MKPALIFALIAICLQPLHAQKGLAGLWEGTITEGGIYAAGGHRFELFLEVNEKYIKGRSYIYIGQDSIVQMALRGQMYNDRSVYLEEASPNWRREEEGAIGAGVPPKGFTRKYQFVYKRGLEGSSLEGYWQEVTSMPFHDKRQRGRIFLRRNGSKA